MNTTVLENKLVVSPPPCLGCACLPSAVYGPSDKGCEANFATRVRGALGVAAFDVLQKYF